jgi:hypothetical protein
VYGLWDNTNQRFSPGVRGRYLIVARSENASVSARSFTEIWQNGAQVRRGHDNGSGSNTNNQGCIVVSNVNLTATDYLEVYFYTNSAGNTSTGFALMYFEIAWAGTY